MNLIKKAKWAFLVYTIIAIALGIWMIIGKSGAATTIIVVFGVLMIIFGALQILQYFAGGKNSLIFNRDLAYGILSVIIGLLLVVFSGTALEIAFVAFGVFIILDGVNKLQTALNAKAAKLTDWWAMLLIALVSIALGVLVILYKFVAADIAMVILGVALIVNGLENLYNIFCVNRVIKIDGTKKQSIDGTKK